MTPAALVLLAAAVKRGAPQKKAASQPKCLKSESNPPKT